MHIEAAACRILLCLSGESSDQVADFLLPLQQMQWLGRRPESAFYGLLEDGEKSKKYTHTHLVGGLEHFLFSIDLE